MRETQEREWVGKLRDYAREALIGVSTGEGSPQRVDTAQNTARAAAGRFKDRRLRGASAHPPPRKSTPHYTIGYSTPAERGRGLYATVRAGVGFLRSPAGGTGLGRGRADRGGQRKVYAQGGTGGL